jgi:hypothetical protein
MLCGGQRRPSEEAIQTAEIRVKNKRSHQDTQEMVLTMAKYGNHYIEKREGVRLETDEDVKRYVEEEYDITFYDLVELCRSKDEKVSIFENVLGSGWQVSAGGDKVSYVDESGDKTVLASDGESGTFTVPGYLGLFEQAVDEFNRCLNSKQYGDFLSCISNGVASIEGYLGQKVKSHNKHNPGKALIDNKQNKVSFDDKINKWIPILTGGTKLNKGTQRWEHYKKLRNIRDQQQAHLKAAALGADYRKLAKMLNLFRTGIAGMLLDLHIVFGERNVAATIIRHSYLPEVEYFSE